LLVAGAVFVLLSLATYQPGDVGQASGEIPVFNYIGKGGAWTALALFLLLGWGAYSVPVFLLGEGVGCLAAGPGPRRPVAVRLLLELAAVLSFAPLFSIQTSIPDSRIGWELQEIGLGGAWGAAAGGFLFENLGLVGSRLVLITVLVVSISVLTDLKPFFIAGAAAARLGRGIASLFRRRRRPRVRPPVPETARPALRPPVMPTGAKRTARRPGSPAAAAAEAQRRQRQALESRRREMEARKQEKKREEAEARAQKEAEARKRREEKKQAKEQERQRRLQQKQQEKPASVSAPAEPSPPRPAPPAPARPRAASARKAAPGGPFVLPSTELLDQPAPSRGRAAAGDADQNARVLETTLMDFGIEAKVVGMEVGPAISRYEVEPAPGVKVGRVKALENDIALAMKATSVRILAPIPGKGAIGIEVPNPSTTLVSLREMVESHQFRSRSHVLPIPVGKDLSGKPVITDLTKIPHLLIAGATGSGKTVCINGIIMGFLFARTPDELKLIMVDPKKVEMTAYTKIPHLLCPVITEAGKAAMALNWLVKEMEERYDLLARVPARNIAGYNNRDRSGDEEDMPERLPYIVLLIDELADLMITAPREIESAIARLAQLSRAVGIHMILATQRPSVDVITGIIKANFPGRISFKVAAKVDSRTVLDAGGADKLLGNGDLLFVPPGSSNMLRAQGTFCHDHEITAVVDFINQQRSPEFDRTIFSRTAAGPGAAGGGAEETADDPMLEAAIDVIRENGQASVSILQRKLKIGYSRAARVMDVLEEKGVVGPAQGMKPREILIATLADQAVEPED